MEFQDLIEDYTEIFCFLGVEDWCPFDADGSVCVDLPIPGEMYQNIFCLFELCSMLPSPLLCVCQQYLESRRVAFGREATESVRNVIDEK
jgi:hypothetical protein